MTIRVFLSVALLATGAFAQVADSGFALDPSKPYVYILFDHVGPRKPLRAGEDPQGLWLRIINNCKVPIGLKSYGPSSGDGVVGILDEVLPIQQGFPVQLDLGDISSPAKRPQQKMPQGYTAELYSVTQILPGQSILFSVPRDHVSHDWFMRVKFSLNVSKPSAGPGPMSELDFFDEQILSLPLSTKSSTSHEGNHASPSPK
jgi:hypothetical protein